MINKLKVLSIIGACGFAMVANIGSSVPALAENPQASANKADPFAGEFSHEQAKKLMNAVGSILKDAAKERTSSRKLPSSDEFLVTPIWTETREDREENIRELLDSALGVVTDVPIVDVQKQLEARRNSIREIEDQIVTLKERRLTAPKDALLPGLLNDTVPSLTEEIDDLKIRITDNKSEIIKLKGDIHQSLSKSGIKMSKEQLDLLLDSVLSGDLVRLVATFHAARAIDEQLSKMVSATGDNVKAARKYFAMHSALFAMLVHAQDSLIKKIDHTYMPRLKAINNDIKKATNRSRRLLNGRNRPDQERTLNANLKSQKFAARVASYYRDYLKTQRQQLAAARERAVRDLEIADNTFETVEASFQLNALIKDAAASFEAIQKLDAPGFDQIFQNQELRREFENLTRKLDVPMS